MPVALSIVLISFLPCFCCAIYVTFVKLTTHISKPYYGANEGEKDLGGGSERGNGSYSF